MDCDLTEPGAAGQVLRATRPDRVFHLAGAAVVATSWALRADVLRTNLEATYQLCEGLRRHPVPCLIVSSGEVYGVVPEDEQPISEARRWAPGSPYALSKASQELYAGYYARSEGLPLVIVRAFNHVGPRQGLGFVWSDVARQIAQIERGTRSPGPRGRHDDNPARLHRRARHGPGVLAPAGPRRAGSHLQRRLRARRRPSRKSSTPSLRGPSVRSRRGRSRSAFARSTCRCWSATRAGSGRSPAGRPRSPSAKASRTCWRTGAVAC